MDHLLLNGSLINFRVLHDVDHPFLFLGCHAVEQRERNAAIVGGEGVGVVRWRKAVFLLVEAEHVHGVGSRAGADALLLELVHPGVAVGVDGLDSRRVAACGGLAGALGLEQAGVALVAVGVAGVTGRGGQPVEGGEGAVVVGGQALAFSDDGGGAVHLGAAKGALDVGHAQDISGFGVVGEQIGARSQVALQIAEGGAVVAQAA